MIIGLNGNAFAGKDTVGKYLVTHYQFERVSFADKVKEATAAVLNIPVDMVDQLKVYRGGSVLVQVMREDPHDSVAPVSQMTFRHFLQRMGTEMGRKVFGEDFWVEQVFPLPNRLYNNSRIVVTDCRFDNEAQRIKDLGGYIVRVEANEEVRLSRGKKPESHVSEDGINVAYIDHVIHNNSTLSDLYNEIEEMLTEVSSEG